MIRFRGATSRQRSLNFKQVKQVQKIVNANKQLKQKYTSVAAAPTTAGSLTELSAIGEGDDFNQRTTDSINAHSLRVQWSLQAADTPTEAQMRIMIVRAKLGTLALADLPATLGAPDIDDIQVLYDEIIKFQDSNIDPMQKFHFKSFKNKKVPHMVIKYDDDVSATAAQDNALYFYAVSDEDTNPPQVLAQANLKYYNR